MFKHQPLLRKLLAFALPLVFLWGWAACASFCTHHNEEALAESESIEVCVDNQHFVSYADECNFDCDRNCFNNTGEPFCCPMSHAPVSTLPERHATTPKPDAESLAARELLTFTNSVSLTQFTRIEAPPHKRQPPPFILNCAFLI